MWFVLGVVLMMVGVALCLLGPIKLPGGRVLRTRYAQVCGAILLTYFPLMFMLQPYIGEWDDVFKHLVNAGLVSLNLLLVLFIILKTTQPPKPVRKHAATLPPNSPLFADPPQESMPPVERQSSRAAPSKDKNMFDFK